MSAVRILGYILFVAGVIVAISAGAKMPEEGQDFPTTWPIFLGGAFVGIVGVGVWRADVIMTRRAEAGEKTTTDQDDPVVLLWTLIGPALRLQSDRESLDADELCHRVEELLERYVQPFAENRQEIINQFGMAQGAEILVAMAYAERMLNRVWSAAADGYLGEARACAPEAVQAIEEAQTLVEQALTPAV